MNLLRRLVAILIPTVMVGLVVVFTLVSYLVLRDLKSLERDQALEDISQYRQAVDEELDVLDSTARDWSHWTDTYEFVVGNFPQYLEVDLAPKSFASYGLGFMVIADANGTLVYGTGFDPATEAFLDLPAELSTPGGRSALGIADLAARDGNVRGLATVGGIPYLVSAWSILTSEETGPPRGTMVWGRAVTNIPLDDLEASLHGDVSWFAAGDPPANARHARPVLDSNPTAIDWHGDESLHVFTRLDDLTGQPAVVLVLDQQRAITQEGYNMLELAFFASLVVAGGFILLGVAFLSRFVVRPVRQLEGRVREIREGSSDRTLPGGSNDEVAALATSFQDLLLRLDQRTAELETSNRDLSSFASVVSHDLQSPLSTLFVSLTPLRQDAQARGDAKALERMERIERTGKAISSRVQALLEYARAGKAQAKLQAVDPNLLAAEVRRDMAADFGKTLATLNLSPMPQIQADPALLNSILQNLFSNAIKYSKPGTNPTLRMGGDETNDEVRLWVEDDGLGFEDRDVADMMTPFKRLDRTRSIPGHGIGLATCARILERHGGRLEAKGNLGVGSRFTLVFPKGPPPASPPGPQP